jgi:hypothetical protein
VGRGIARGTKSCGQSPNFRQVKRGKGLGGKSPTGALLGVEASGCEEGILGVQPPWFGLTPWERYVGCLVRRKNATGRQTDRNGPIRRSSLSLER